ncbi:MAG: AAA family ATPase [Gemmatimonadaceae bacterium]|nr:AAA family ATPase [Gemmatimonadaceae bacterium]
MTIHFTSLSIAQPPYLGGGTWILEGLNHITVLFGKNGSGKSILLRTLLSQSPNNRHLALPERPGSLQFEPRFVTEESSGANRAGNRQQNTLTDYRQRTFARLQVLIQKRGFLLKPGSTDDTIEDLHKLMKDLLPDFTLRVTSEMPYFQLQRSDGTLVTEVNQVSSGEIGMISIAVDLATICGIWHLENTPERLLLVDEPDTHLHPDLQEYLAAFLLKLAEKYSVQMIVATHSTTLLAALGYHGKEKTSAIYLNRSTLPQEAIKFTKHLQEVSSCLGGHALMGPLFGSPLLLVEGDDDYRAWSQVPRHHVIKLAVLPCDGEEIFKYQKTLEQIFDSLRTTTTPPAGYALLDGDKRLPTGQTTPQDHVPFLRLECRESENLYLADEVIADLGVDWPTGCIQIKAQADKYGNKEAGLLGCDGWDRKSVDIKHLINELSAILDPKNVHWTKRVGTAIGKAKPSGQLADFLGPTILEALWD